MTKFLVFATADQNIYLWDYNNSQNTQLILSNAKHFTCIDNDKIAFIDATNSTLKIWNYTTQNMLPQFLDLTKSLNFNHNYVVNCLTTLDDDHIAFCVSTVIYIWNWKTKQLQTLDRNNSFALTHDPYSLTQFTAGTNNTLLSVYSDTHACLWNWKTRCLIQHRESIGHYDYIKITALKDGTFVAVCNRPNMYYCKKVTYHDGILNYADYIII